jgi:ribonuclease HI
MLSMIRRRCLDDDCKKKKKSKYYVVFRGLRRGIYDTWEECQKNVSRFPQASFASFDSKTEAERAFLCGDLKKWRETSSSSSSIATRPSTMLLCKDGPILCVDAACSGFPGPVEYRGVLLSAHTVASASEEVFHYGPFRDGSNNIGEFLAIATGLRWLHARSLDYPVYSDSKCAIGWILGNDGCNTTVSRDAMDPELRTEIEEAEKWLSTCTWATKKCRTLLHKWDTDRWGEIPADFGRK